MTTVNDELVKVFGVKTNWSHIISSCIAKRASREVKKGYFDDLFVDVTSDLIMKSQSGGFAIAISKAKANSSTNQELLKNIKNVVVCAVYYRISNVLKKHKSIGVPFSQISVQNLDFEAKSKNNDCLDLVIDELRLMIKEHPDKTDRYEFAILMLLKRLSGWSQTELNEKHNLTDYQVKLLNKDWNLAFERMVKE